MTGVAEVISNLAEQPVVLLGIVVLVGLFVFAAMTRLVKLVLILVLGFATVSGYFALTGTEAPESLRRLQEELGEKVKEGARTGAGRIKGSVGEDLKEAALDHLSDTKEEAEIQAEEALEAARNVVEHAEDPTEVLEGF